MQFKCTYKHCGQLLNPAHIAPEHNGVHWFFTCPVCAFKSDLVMQPTDGSSSVFVQPNAIEVPCQTGST